MLPPSPPQNSLVSSIRNSMIEISGIARANGGLILSIPGVIKTSEVYVQEVLVEMTSEVATFAVSWPSQRDVISLELESPDGEIITISSAPSNVRPIYTDRPYVGFQINQPVSGIWKLIVKAEQVTESTNFDLFVFSQNPRISGGILSPSRFYKLGEIIPLQFQAYFDRPITGIKVVGIVILPNSENILVEFSDDEKKDPQAGRPGNGLYTGSLQSMSTPRIYKIKVVAESDGVTATYAKSDHPPADGENYEYDPIPAFRREFTLTMAVGEVPVSRVEIEPNTGYLGQKLQVTLRGNLTHFKQDYTSLDFGEGISVSDIRVIDDLTTLATLKIAQAATLGFRRIVATTDAYKETVRLEEGFQVVPRKWAWSDKWIIRLLILIIILLIIVLLIMAMSLLRGR